MSGISIFNNVAERDDQQSVTPLRRNGTDFVGSKPAPPRPSAEYVSLAFDARSPLTFLQRVGLILWLGQYGREGF